MAFSFAATPLTAKTWRCGFIALVLLCTALPAFGWGPQGHRLVARLAEQELTPAARAEITRLLAGESDPTLAGVANWADDIRDSDAALYRRTARWHFVNIAERGCNYQARRDCRGDDCVVEAIRRQAAILADRRQALAARRDALKFVVHFVGDVHQPLHAGYARDRGGNDTQISDDGFGTNLHALWDSRLVYRQRMGDDRYVDALVGKPMVVELPRKPLPPPAAEWAEASCAIVLQPGFYPARPALERGYYANWTPTAEAQLKRAGARLAQLLNAALPAR